jgi:hypothetical protein
MNARRYLADLSDSHRNTVRRVHPHGGLLILAAGILGVGAGSNAFAGSVFVTGHDPDFHGYVGANAVGAQNLIKQALNFTRDGNTAPILLLETSNDNAFLGDHVDSEQGLIASGYSGGNTAGNHYVKVSASQFATVDLSQYSSLFIPSDHGGSLTGDDLKALDARAGDVMAYLNAGGGLFAMAEDGFHTATASPPEAALFGFLPFLATSAPQQEYENGNVLTPFGLSLGLVNGDINGNFSHNIFTSTGGMTPVDRDAGGEILSLAWRGGITTGGVPDGGSSLLLLGLGSVALGSLRLRWRRTA